MRRESDVIDQSISLIQDDNISHAVACRGVPKDDPRHQSLIELINTVQKDSFWRGVLSVRCALKAALGMDGYK